jgi:hypothetical protein
LNLAVVQRGEHLERGLADLVEFLAAHAAGAIDDERHLAPEQGAVGPVPVARRQAGEQEEIAAADLRIGVGEQRRRDRAARAEEAETERARLASRPLGELRRHLVRPRLDRAQAVARRVHGRHRRGRRDLDRDLPRHGVLDRLAAREDVIHPVAGRGEQVFVGQPDRLRAPWLDREDAGADEVIAGELEQGGVARLRDDLLVRRSRLVPRQQPRRGLGARPLEREPPHDGPLRHRDEQLRLLADGAGVTQAHLHHRRRGLVADDDADVDPRDLERRRSAERPGLRDDHVRPACMGRQDLRPRARRQCGPDQQQHEQTTTAHHAHPRIRGPDVRPTSPYYAEMGRAIVTTV